MKSVAKVADLAEAAAEPVGEPLPNRNTLTLTPTPTLTITSSLILTLPAAEPVAQPQLDHAQRASPEATLGDIKQQHSISILASSTFEVSPILAHTILLIAICRGSPCVRSGRSFCYAERGAEA